MTTSKSTLIKNHIFFIFLPIVFSVFGEFLLKFAANETAITPDKAGLILFFTSPPIIISVLSIVCAGLLWVVGLSKFELSYAYPFLSLNYVAILVGSRLFFGEQVTLTRLVAMVFIIAGLIVISRSPYSESEGVKDAN
ncbi:hypothetical protein HOH87_04620 [bacterium]|jgi:multidrug transporter EmrE-like cation transporter|nr:hypothetical protein [bacterium]